MEHGPRSVNRAEGDVVGKYKYLNDNLYLIHLNKGLKNCVKEILF
jgi:hypothetical protein